MEQVLDDTAEMLAACLQSCPITLTVLKDVNAYNVRTRSGRVIWADDLPLGGYPALLQSFSLLLVPEERRHFLRILADDVPSERYAPIASVNAFMALSPGWRLHIEREQKHGTLLLNIAYNI